LGNGLYNFVDDNENISEKVISLLADSITPYLEKFQMQIIPPNKVFSIFPNPATLTCIRKN